MSCSNGNSGNLTCLKAKVSISLEKERSAVDISAIAAAKSGSFIIPRVPNVLGVSDISILGLIPFREIEQCMWKRVRRAVTTPVYSRRHPSARRTLIGTTKSISQKVSLMNSHQTDPVVAGSGVSRPIESSSRRKEGKQLSRRMRMICIEIIEKLGELIRGGIQLSWRGLLIFRKMYS